MTDCMFISFIIELLTLLLMLIISVVKIFIAFIQDKKTKENILNCKLFIVKVDVCTPY